MTRPAYVYMAQDEQGSIKVGCSFRPHVRLSDIKDNDNRPVLIGQFRVRDKATAHRVEKAAHWLLKEQFCRRWHYIATEWFAASPEVVAECIRKAIRADRRAAKEYHECYSDRLSMVGKLQWWHAISMMHPDKTRMSIKHEMIAANKELAAESFKTQRTD